MIVIVVYNIPGPQTVGDLVFIPLRFVVAWVAGYALRERAEQAEAAEERAAQAEREREAAARSRWRRSVRGSPASSTTSSPTPSA